MRRVLVAATAALALVVAGTPAAAAGAPGATAHATRAPAGSPGIGDPYFPDHGNGGYDVSHYDLRLRYWPSTDRLTGTATILARATDDLTQFNLDFALDATSVRVNGWPATAVRQGSHELVVTPVRTVRAGQLMTIVVQYQGTPSQVSVDGITAWQRTADGALAVGEPEIAWWWFPSNDHPRDKATFDISVLVPDGVEVISNGVLTGRARPELVGWSRWSYRHTKPMATYLALLAIGQYEIVTDVTQDGKPVLNAYSDRLGDSGPAARASIERTAEITDWLSGVVGPYPFEALGGVAGPPDGVGFALENQTRPYYGYGFWRRGSNPYVVVHELAHQWFGDSVSVYSWRDIWLNEGFASYLEWLYSETVGEGTAQELFDYTYASIPAGNPFWQVVVGDPGPANIFSPAVYDRGAMALHQLRLAIGDAAFFALLRTWTERKRYGNGTIEEFEALAEETSGREISDILRTWLFTSGKPVLAGSPAARSAQASPVEPKSWVKIRDVHARHAHG